MKVEQLIKLLEAVPPDSEVMIKTWNDDGDHEFTNPLYTVTFKPQWVAPSEQYTSRPNQLILS